MMIDSCLLSWPQMQFHLNNGPDWPIVEQYRMRTGFQVWESRPLASAGAWLTCDFQLADSWPKIHGVFGTDHCS